MATREWSQAEREKASIQVVTKQWPSYFCDELLHDIASDLEERHPYTKTAITLQCELNDLRAQIEEAHNIIDAYLHGWDSEDNAHKVRNWMDRNPETK